MSSQLQDLAQEECHPHFLIEISEVGGVFCIDYTRTQESVTDQLFSTSAEAVEWLAQSGQFPRIHPPWKRKRGRPRLPKGQKPSEGGPQICFRLPSDTYHEFQKVAESEGMSPSEWVKDQVTMGFWRRLLLKEVISHQPHERPQVQTK